MVSSDKRVSTCYDGFAVVISVENIAWILGTSLLRLMAGLNFGEEICFGSFVLEAYHLGAGDCWFPRRHKCARDSRFDVRLDMKAPLRVLSREITQDDGLI